jgi:hypothetical protein
MQVIEMYILDKHTFKYFEQNGQCVFPVSTFISLAMVVVVYSSGRAQFKLCDDQRII